MPSSVRLVSIVWTHLFELVGFCPGMSRRLACSPLPRPWGIAGVCLDGYAATEWPLSRRRSGGLGSRAGEISVTGCGGLSDNLSRPSRLSRLDRYKMRIRVDLSRHALYISAWTV